MTRPPLLLPALVVALLGAAPALADDLDEPGLTRSRGLTVVSVQGRASGSGPLEVGLGRGDAVALRAPLHAAEDGALRGALSTRRVLLPGPYELRLLRGEEVLARRAWRLGSEAEERASQAREQRWIAEALRAARGLCVSLERTAGFQRRLELAPAEGLVRIKGFLAGWRYQLRQARADLALFERRVVLPYVPAAIAGLGRLHAALAARARAWEQAFGPQAGEPPGEDAELQASLRALLEAAGMPPELERWGPGELATPPRWEGLQAGSVWRADGFELPIPAGWVAAGAPSRPELRLHLRPEGAQSVVATVSVSEAPDVTDLAGLEALHETGNWESYPGYSHPRLERPESGGLVVRFQYDPAGARAPADAARPPVQVAQRVLFQPARGRVWVLAVSWAGASEPAELPALLDGFRLAEGN